MTIRLAVFWVAAACCAVAELAILRSLLFGRARDAERHGTPYSKLGRLGQIAWAVIPAAGLVLVLYLTWRAVDAAQTPRPSLGHSGATIGAA